MSEKLGSGRPRYARRARSYLEDSRALSGLGGTHSRGKRGQTAGRGDPPARVARQLKVVLVSSGTRQERMRYHIWS